VLEQIGDGKGYIDMSTVDAATSCKISEVSSPVLVFFSLDSIFELLLVALSTFTKTRALVSAYSLQD
jgi:hypothetical protein